jgi:hypothetical protein
MAPKGEINGERKAGRDDNERLKRVGGKVPFGDKALDVEVSQ